MSASIREAFGEPRKMTFAEAVDRGIPMPNDDGRNVRWIWVFGPHHYYEETDTGEFYCLVGNEDILDSDRTKVEDFLWDRWVKHEM
jgi:hypothetical protein